MKKIILSDWIVIVVGLATIITTIYATEIKTKIMELLSKWQILLLILATGILIWRIIFIYVRNKMQSLEIELNKKNIEQDKSDTAVFNAIMKLKDETFALKIFNHCLIEEITQYYKLNIKDITNIVIEPKMQIESIRQNALKKMNALCKKTRTDEEKEKLLNSVWYINEEIKLNEHN